MTFQNELIDKTSATLSRINWSCIGAMIILLLITSFAQKNIPIAVTAETAPRYRDWETDRKSTRLNSSHSGESRMPSSA